MILKSIITILLCNREGIILKYPFIFLNTSTNLKHRYVFLYTILMDLIPYLLSLGFLSYSLKAIVIYYLCGKIYFMFSKIYINIYGSMLIITSNYS